MEIDKRKLLRNFVIELILYGLLVFAYFVLVLRLLGEPLTALYETSLVIYAGVAIALLIIQSVALEFVTSFLVSLLGLERLE